MGVKNFEMEASTLFTLCAMRGFRSGAVCAAVANRHHNVFIDPEKKTAAEDAGVSVALAALEALARLDQS